MRFCVALSHGGWANAADPVAAVERTVEVARIADEAGLDSLWVNEDPDGWDAFALLGSLARETGRIRLGPGVTNPYLRHPNTLAACVATLDRLSGGRAVLGLGRGQTEWYAQALGMDVGRPLAALAETIRLLRAWETPPFAAASPEPETSHFRVRAWRRSVAPLQRRVPIVLAAVGPKALALAGRLADGVLFNDLASVDYVRAAVAATRESAAAAGRDPAALAFYARAGVRVVDDPERVLEARKTTIAMIHALPGMERLLETPGFDVAAIVAEVRRAMRTEEVLARGGGFADLRETGDLAAAKRAIPTDLVARLAVVGPLPHVQARLRELAAAGVTHVFLAPPGPRQTAEGFRELVASLTVSPAQDAPAS